MPNGSYTNEQLKIINKIDTRLGKCMEAKNGKFVKLNQTI